MNRLLASLAAFTFTGIAAAHDADVAPGGKLGKVSFPSSCSPAVQPEFERAVAMLHSFWYSAGEALFQEIAKKDPGCAPIANWGYASLLMNNPLAGQGALPANVPKAQAAIDEARRIGAKTQRERDYIDAVAAYYADFANKPERARQAARAAAYEALAAKYPNDDEAQIFSALYIAGTQSQADQTYAAYLKAAGILEPLFRKYPDHPGVAHYLIHSYDAPPIAARGLDAARRYAVIAPAAPHALHMPSHIFTRVGAWQESAAINLRSFEVAKAGNEGNEAYHAMDYAVYAYLQQARDAEARRSIQEAMKVKDYNPNIFVAPYAIAAMQARYALERADWRTAMDLAPGKSKFPHVEAITYFTRAIGAIRARTPSSAEEDALALEAIHKSLLEAKNTYWATEVEVQQLTVAAWLAHARGKSDEAVKLMRAAADLEDTNEKHIVTPGRVVPARELLGEMLLEQNQPGPALAELDASRKREPNRFRNYSVASKAANLMGDKAKAQEYAAKLLELSKDADTRRTEINQAYNLIVRK